ncbi:hypothetical protein [Sphingomonas sp. LB3N6]|uniref:hypothetical protein n=1 Tax=Sphingomonas fucosidasi TaxID=3096164 RepID=UPI002FC947B0
MGFGTRMKAVGRWIGLPFSYLSTLTICTISPAPAQAHVMVSIAALAQPDPLVIGTGRLPGASATQASTLTARAAVAATGEAK